MTSEEIIFNCLKYYKILIVDNIPERVPELEMKIVKEYGPEDREKWLKHACYLAQNIPCMFLQCKVEDHRLREKIGRHYGSLQTMLWFTGISCMSESMMDNMNPGASFEYKS